MNLTERRDQIDKILQNAGIYHYKNDKEREQVITTWDESNLTIEEIVGLHTVTEEQFEQIKKTDNYKQFSKEAVENRAKEYFNSKAGVF